ncbi:hypothetical protein, partial [uncultured Rikenella sp.]|uniref:hypothetical protein n=1 Tax=uncultured Rikenella sp. TaxID=368003 RepID=UPI0026010936
KVFGAAFFKKRQFRPAQSTGRRKIGIFMFSEAIEIRLRPEPEKTELNLFSMALKSEPSTAV